MIDFTSSLYLGMKHGNTELAGWSQLTTGVPAALHESYQSKYIGNFIARMQGLETGLTAPSTLHLYWDLFGFLSKQKITVFVDEKIYPVSKYGIERLIVKNLPVYSFKHMDAGDLYRQISKRLQPYTTPIVFTDGLCPQCGKIANILEYRQILTPFNGKIIIDDTQAFGILGKRKDAFAYGYGGGGILQWLDISDENIVVIASLAKAFGVPISVIAGSMDFISAFENSSSTRESSSPVSIAHLCAATNAIVINKHDGNRRRKLLLDNILLIRKQLLHAGIQLHAGFFPVQHIISRNETETADLFNKLNERKFKTVMTRSHLKGKPQITFIINYEHSAPQLLLFANTIKQLHQSKNAREYSFPSFA
jgi:8-amino-7-oxononanoate synthase